MSDEYQEVELPDYRKVAFSRALGMDGPYYVIHIHGHDSYICLRSITRKQWQQIKSAGDAAFGEEAEHGS